MHRFAPSEGELEAAPAVEGSAHPALRHGFATIPPGSRGMVHADGTPAFMVVDTAWALPFRATAEDVTTYAADRAAKHFTTVFLMAVQPDMDARGPRGRGVDGGFDVAFEDLPDGRLEQIDVDYWRYVRPPQRDPRRPRPDARRWPRCSRASAGRACARPAPSSGRRTTRASAATSSRGTAPGPTVFLVGADGTGEEQGIGPAGARSRPGTRTSTPSGSTTGRTRPTARTRTREWLDFQSCQTGHDGDHTPDRLATMWGHRPVKAIMNGEPTYERSGRPDKATGWWQGHEAWSNVCAGGLLGVAYGAGSLWQWRLSPSEEGHAPFFLAEDAGWREALDFEGSRYVGLVGHILRGLPLHEAEPCWDVVLRSRGLLAPGRSSSPTPSTAAPGTSSTRTAGSATATGSSTR